MKAKARGRRLPAATPPAMAYATGANSVTRLAEAMLPTRFGTFRIVIFHDDVTQAETVALIHGDIRGEAPALVRLHSECLTGDVLGSLRCDCGEQLEEALR